jgi:uncharacterized LabA/DUF88 family protein
VTEKRLAVLIDADNVSAAHLGPLLAEIANLGVPSVRRMYGDWTTTQLRSWKEAAHQHAVQPVQQFAYTQGKNSTDSALIIDAMDLLHTERFDGFCLVSSDSDFTRLATRLRESGVTVYGFGARKTPEPFVNACDRFTFLEVLAQAEESSKASTVKRPPERQLRGDAKLVGSLRRAIDAASDDNGWANLAAVGSVVRNQSPEFDPRNWGFAKLGDLVAAIGLFEVQNGSGNVRLVRNKE